MTDSYKEYTIAKYRATQLGYTPEEIGSGRSLGRFVGKQVPASFKRILVKYSVNHYEVNDTLDSVIHSYFS